MHEHNVKRAGFNWGIGRELYTAPFIWIPASNCNIFDTGRKDKYNRPVYGCKDRFYVAAMNVSEDPRRIVFLTIASNNKVVYQFGNQPRPDADEAAERLAARAQCQKAVKSYVQRSGADENACWAEIAESIGKASKNFTKEDWNRAQKIAEGWA